MCGQLPAQEPSSAIHHDCPGDAGALVSVGSFISQAAALLSKVKKGIAVMNTSQSLTCMPHAAEGKPLPCLTCCAQDSSMALDVVYYFRPKGKYLVLGKTQRFLLGWEAMALMGMPLHRMDVRDTPDHVPFRQISADMC